MDRQGLSPYLYDYIFFRVIDQTQRVTQVPITTSSARRLRERVDEVLQANTNPPQTLHSPFLGANYALEAIEQAMSDVPGYREFFPAVGNEGRKGSKNYAELLDRFSQITGHSTTKPEARPRLPISPYDPRFSGREVMREAGHEMRFAMDRDVSRYAGGDVTKLDSITDPSFVLSAYDEGLFVDSGQAMTINDASGLTSLSEYMSREEFTAVSGWVAQVAGRDGSFSSSDFMSRGAVQRASSILRMLNDEGVAYTVRKDLNPGQIKASITGTKIDVRLMDTPENEHYVGRTWDDGAAIYFSSDIKAEGNKSRGYVPSSGDVLNLVRYAQGRAVERTDGQGYVGQNGGTTKRETYRTAQILSSVYGDYPGVPGGKVLIQKNTKDRTPYFDSLNGEAVARKYLEDSIASARSNFVTELNADSLVVDVLENRDAIVAGDYVPELSSDSSIAGIQQSYIDVLTGRTDQLLKPGATEELYDELVGTIGTDADVLSTDGERLAGVVYDGSAIEQIRQHSGDVADYIIGQYDAHEVTQPDGSVALQRFDPVRVAQYMTSPSGSWRNTDNLVLAMRQTDILPDELMGNNYYNDTVKNRLIRFDEATSVDMTVHDDPFIARMGDVVRGSLERNGVDVGSVRIDDQGVVQYTGTRYTSPDVNKAGVDFTGHIGQIFSRGEHGEVVTKFGSGANYMFVPGYEARVVPQAPGETKSLEERMRLRGYEDIMAERIEYSISQTMLDPMSSNTDEPIVIGETASLNNVYRQLYDVRHPVDYIERSAEEGLDRDLMEAILATEARRVRLPNELRDESALMADYQDRMGQRGDPRNDNFRDPYLLSGQRNIAVLSHEGDGYLDPMMTSSGKNQGAIRYLTESASVDGDGRIIQGELGDNAPLMNHPATKHCIHDPFDRRQMTGSNMLQAAAVSKPVGTAMMTFGGWNFDDGYVISKKFAETHQIRDVQGNMRSIVRGDKLSDLHGNKGVVGLVVDPNAVIDPSDPKQASLAKAIEVFKNNPDLDVVMSPFSAVSRFNGGSARELMENTTDLVLDGKVVPGGIGQQRVIVTHMAVDAKTKIYDEDEVTSGKGRKASSQGAWALTSQGADKVMHEMYGTNNAAIANLREMYNVLGLDIDAEGTLLVGRSEQSFDDERQLLPMPPVVRHAKGGIDRNAMRRAFAQTIGSKGGNLALPFELKFPEHTQSPSVDPDKRRDLLPTMTNPDGSTSYLLPVMSSHLRSGQELDDGTTTTHEYTNAYLDIYMEAVKYTDAQEKLTQGDLRPDARKRYQKVVDEAPSNAQTHFDRITNSVIERCVEGKHNMIKEGLMSHRMPDSATAVWTGDPRLKINEVAMSSSMASALHVKQGESVLIWRDPMLRDAGMRQMKVEIDDELTGVAINPVMDKCFDGDFDGDAVAVVALRGKEAVKQAEALLSVEANLLDTDCRREPVVGKDGETYMCYPLAMQDALDAKVSQHVDPELKDEFDYARIEINRVEDEYREGKLSDTEIKDAREALTEELSDYYSRAVGQQYGDAVIEFSDITSHFESVRHSCIETGAKGTPGKLNDYARYFGARELAKTPGQWIDLGSPQVTQEDHEGVQLAQAVKSTGTAFAGANTQRCVKATRNTDISAGLGMTYFITQAALQSKHSPVEALKRFDAIQGPGRLTMQGVRLKSGLDNTGKPSWTVKYGEDGDPEPIYRDQWVKQTLDIYTSENGLNVKDVNPELIERMADVLSDSKGMMRNAEEAVDLMAPMDQLAYGGSFETLHQFASTKRNLFEGKNNAMFMPNQVRHNAEVLAQFDASLAAGQQVTHEPEVQPIVKRDTQAGYAPRPKASPRAAGVKRRIMPEPEPEPEVEPTPDDGGFDY